MKIKGVEYEVVLVRTRESIEQTHPNTHKAMLASKQVAQYYIKRPKGNKLFMVVEYEDGSLSSLVSL